VRCIIPHRYLYFLFWKLLDESNYFRRILGRTANGWTPAKMSFILYTVLPNNRLKSICRKPNAAYLQADFCKNIFLPHRVRNIGVNSAFHD